MSRKKKKTYRGVFIIESTDDDDEEHDRKEGKALTAMLELAKRPVLYRYIRTKKELDKMLKQFHGTTYRYLHLACHGNADEIGLNCDDLNLEQLADRLVPFMDNRRLFISACQGAQLALAEPLLRSSKCYSVVGPAQDIAFDDSAIAWASFYALMSKKDPDRMVREDIEAILERVCAFHGLSFNAFFKEDGKVVMRKFGPTRFPRLGTDGKKAVGRSSGLEALAHRQPLS
jgi:hypothetical protein